MTGATLCLFKSSRRLEYTLENLRILSGAVGDEVDVTYLERWMAAEVLERLPRTGDEAIVVLADPPYAKSYPIRRVRLDDVTWDGGVLRMRTVLGARVHADLNRWKSIADAGVGPRDWTFVSRLPMNAETIREVPDHTADLREWKGQVDHIGRAEGYGRIAFVRVGGVKEVGGDATPWPLELQVGRMYELEVVSRNKHLDADVLSSLRLVGFPDPAVMDVAMDDEPLPVDGSVSITVEARAEGPATLELSVMRGGGETWGGAMLSWLGVPLVPEVPVTPEEVAAAVVQQGPEPPSASQEVVASQPIPDPSVDAVALSDIVGALLHSYRLVRDELGAIPAVRLRLVDEWLTAIPASPRLLAQRGVLLHDVARHEEAAALLETLPSDVLDREARQALVGSWFRCGRLPEPIDRVTIADFGRDEAMEILLSASLALRVEDQVALARYLAEHVVSDARASRWLERIAAQPVITRTDLVRLLDLWMYVDPEAAAVKVEHLIDEDRLDLADAQVARWSLELGLSCGRQSLARRSALALVAHHAAAGDAAALESLLGETQALAPEARREISEGIVMAVADVVPDEAPIDAAIEAACTVIEDLRQRGELDHAARLGEFVIANRHRSQPEMQTRVDRVIDRLEAALRGSETIRRYLQLRRAEDDQDLRERLGGKRVLVVGSKHAEWWDAIRIDLGLDDRSEWVETEKRQTPDTDAILRKLSGCDLVVIQTGRIGHKLSEPLIEAARDREVPLARADRPTREAFVGALRRDLLGDA